MDALSLCEKSCSQSSGPQTVTCLADVPSSRRHSLRRVGQSAWRVNTGSKSVIMSGPKGEVGLEELHSRRGLVAGGG